MISRIAFWAVILVPIVVLPVLTSAQDAAITEHSSSIDISIHFDPGVSAEILAGAKPGRLLPYGKPGFPTTYAKVLHVAIPPDSDVSPEILKTDAYWQKAQLKRFQDGEPVEGTFPTQLYEVSKPKTFRQVSYVDVLLFPVQWDTHGKSNIVRSITLRLNFSHSSSSFRAEDLPSISRLYDRFFANSWRDKVSPSVKSASPLSPWQPPAHSGDVYKVVVRKDGIYKLDRDLISANTTWNVSSLDPRNLRLYNNGQQIPLFVSGEQDGTFDVGDAIYFYGKALTGENDAGVWQKGDYTDDNVYWLLVGTTPGLRMVARDVSPASGYPSATAFTSTVHFEQNLQFAIFQNNPDTDLWLWKLAIWASNSSAAVQHHNVTLPSISSDSSFQATLKFEGRGRSFKDANPDHHAVLGVNGTNIGDFYMDDYEVEQVSYNFNQSLLGGTGTLPIDLTLAVTDPALLGIDVDGVSSNWFELTYSRNFEAYNDELFFHYGPGSNQFTIPGFSSSDLPLMDVTDPITPVLLTNAEIKPVSGKYQVRLEDSSGSSVDYYLSVPQVPAAQDFVLDAPSNLGSINAATNWILICPQAWTSSAQVQNLKNYRESQGLNTAVVSVTDIYDEFNYGIFSPYAIRNFLQYVYDLSNPPQLQYVVLLGDADYDYKDYAGDGNFNLVPTYMVAEPGFASVTFNPYSIHSFDNYYGTFAGDDAIPEIFIGRIPARTQSVADVAITKILFYDTGITDHSWLATNLFAADCVNSADFEPEQDENLSHVRPTPPHTSVKMYFAQPPWNCSSKDADGNSISDVVDQLNQGSAITSWVGHGSFQQWGTANYLNMSDLPSLTNTDKPTVMLNANCFTGAFYHTSVQPTLIEAMMTSSAGMVSGFAPGTFMFTFQGDLATESFYSDVFGKDKERSLGALFQHLFMDIDASGDTRLTMGMVEFGDPATTLAIPALPAPQNLAASSSSCGTIDLTWDAPGGQSSYNIFRSTSATGPFVRINGAPVLGQTYSDTPSSGFTYYYYVAALDADGFEGAGSNVVSSFAAPGGLTVLPATLPGVVINHSYGQNLSASGGSGPFSFAVVSGGLPPGINLSASGVFSGTPTQTGDYGFVVMATNADSCGAQSYTISVSCLFCDDFNGSVPNPNWTYTKGTWIEAGGFLQGTYKKKASAIGSPIFSGCSLCTVEADLETTGAQGTVSLYGWYADKKNNLELIMDEHKDQFQIKQRVAGKTTKQKFSLQILPNTNYHVKITFDGSAFQVYVGGNLMTTLTKRTGSSPSGTVGFLVAKTTGWFDSILVY